MKTKRTFFIVCVIFMALFVCSCNPDKPQSTTEKIPAVTNLSAKSTIDGINISWTNPEYDDHVQTIIKIYNESSALIDTIPLDPELTEYTWSDGTHGCVYNFNVVISQSDEQTSNVASAKQFYMDVNDTSALPLVFINTKDNKSVSSKETYVPMSISIVDPSNAENNKTLTGFNEKIRGRGNSTWRYSKKPYKIKFASKQCLFGMEKAKQWVLLANWLDSTMILDSITFKIGQILGMPYNHHIVHVELILNGEYIGNYALTEQNEVGQGRVEIDKTNGFLCEIDDYYDEKPKFKTTHYSMPVMIKSPELKDNNGQEITDSNNPGFAFVVKAMNDFDSALYNVSKKDSNLSSYQDTLYNLIDVNSFAQYIMANDIVQNNELKGPKSFFIYKDNDSKICLGPLWDFDWAWGFNEYIRTRFNNYDKTTTMCTFIKDLYNDSVFKNAYKTLWNSKYSELSNLESEIRTEAAKVKKSYDINRKKWSNSWYKSDYDATIDSMVSWYNSRLSWLDSKIN